MSVKALVEIRDTIRLWIEFRAPKNGELAWAVPADATPEEALDHVACGRDEWSSGEAGFGYRACRDMPEFETLEADDEELPMRNIVVHVDHVRTEPALHNVFHHVKLL